MKIIASLAFVVFCSMHVFAQSAKQIETNIQIVHQVFEALNNHDTLALINLCDDSVHIASPNWEGIQTGKHELANAYIRYFRSDPYLKYSITNIVATENTVVAEYLSEGQMTNLEPGIPEYMRGKKYVLKNCTRISLSNGKVTDIVTYFDQVSFLKQMGFFEQKNQ